MDLDSERKKFFLGAYAEEITAQSFLNNVPKLQAQLLCY